MCVCVCVFRYHGYPESHCGYLLLSSLAHNMSFISTPVPINI